MGRDVGYRFVVALSDAIERATAFWAREDSTAFRYRGADLRHAVERELYIGLVNHRPLQDAYSAGRPFDAVAGLGSALATSVARGLLDPEMAPTSGRPGWRRFGARAAWHARAAREPRPDSTARDVAGPVAFVLDHPKFLSFVEPVRRRLGHGDDLLISNVPAVVQTSPGCVEIDPRQQVAPAGRAIGVGLLGAASLLRVYDALVTTLATRRPRCVVVVEGMSPIDELANRAARAAGIPCICLQQGWSPFVHAGFRNMSFSAMAVWGDGFADLLAPHNPQQRFVAAGSFALAPEVNAGRDELAEHIAGRPAVAFFLQPGSPLIGVEHQAQLRDLLVRTARRLPQCALLVREHPAAPLSDDDRAALNADGAVLVGAARFSLRAVVEAIEVGVSIYSTALLETAALGAVPIVFNPTSMPHYEPDLDALGAGLERRSVSDAEEAIALVVEDPAARQKLAKGVERFRARFFFDGAAPAERIAELVEEVASRG